MTSIGGGIDNNCERTRGLQGRLCAVPTHYHAGLTRKIKSRGQRKIKSRGKRKIKSRGQRKMKSRGQRKMKRNSHLVVFAHDRKFETLELKSRQF